MANESSEILIFIIGILIILFTTARMFWSFILFVLQLFNLKPVYRSLKPEYKTYLNTYFKFYRQLNNEDKILFERRVQFFIDLKTFIPRGGLKTVSSEVKAMIAGSAIQITYGYPDVYFRYFSKILVYPDKYFNKLTNQYHKGEVNLKGIIVLSVKSLKQGWINNEDGVNLGLHEMAHALSVENMAQNSEFNFIDMESVKYLKELAVIEMKRIKQEGNSIFRRYGSASFREFFAVATEVFFEKPETFKAYNTEMYQLMVRILNMDPLQLNLNRV